MSDRCMPKEVAMKDTKSMVSSKEKVDFTIKMEACMMVSGSMVICKATESFTINLKDWHMMENGDKINFVEKELFTMNFHSISIVHSITATLTKYRNFGQNIKVKYLILRPFFRRYEAWNRHSFPIQWLILSRTVQK